MTVQPLQASRPACAHHLPRILGRMCVAHGSACCGVRDGQERSRPCGHRWCLRWYVPELASGARSCIPAEKNPEFHGTSAHFGSQIHRKGNMWRCTWHGVRPRQLRIPLEYCHRHASSCNVMDSWVQHSVRVLEAQFYESSSQCCCSCCCTQALGAD
jgi:hypothetical protein